MESCGDVPGKTSWRSLRTLSDSEPFSCELVRVVPDVIDVIDVPVSLFVCGH